MNQTNPTKPAKPSFSGYEIFVIAILAFLQFTVILDFMVMSPPWRHHSSTTKNIYGPVRDRGFGLCH